MVTAVELPPEETAEVAVAAVPLRLPAPVALVEATAETADSAAPVAEEEEEDWAEDSLMMIPVR